MQVNFLNLKPQYAALKEKINAKLQQVLDHTNFIMGPEIDECEQLLANFVGVRHAITCSNGSDAIQMALMALDIKPGDEIITSPFSFIATAEMPILSGVTPVYVDIDPKTYNLDPDQVEKGISAKTKAIMPVSLYGRPADMKPLKDIADKHSLYLIEDAAQSFGATYYGQRSPGIADIGCTSFFPAKPLGCYGDGGAVFTDNDEWAEKLKRIRVHGQSARYHHTELGINGRMDTLQAAILSVKLERYPWEIDQRQRLAKNYLEFLGSLKSPRLKRLPLGDNENYQSVWAQFTIEVTDRAEIQKQLQDLGVPTAVHYPTTMPDQPAYREYGRVISQHHSQLAARQVMSLPLYPDMPDQEQVYVTEALAKVLKA